MMFPVFSGAIYCCLAVMLGAFGAHGLKEHLSLEDMQIYQTGVQYQFYHGLALILLGCLPHHKLYKTATVLFKTGIIVFSGSLYLLVLTDIRKFGMITPIGGVCFILAWGFLAAGAFQLRNSQAHSQQST
jgi:uncharacterized membrane protein YgdD (TMEM256/DUF423 family)